MTIETIIDGVISRESEKFTNNPNDSGGPTRYGITQRTLSRYRGKPAMPVEVENLTVVDARLIYRWFFVDEPGFDRLALISPSIGEEVIDTGVNFGPAIAATMLQRSLNAFNLNGTKYPDLEVDGDCGERTVAALRSFLAWRGKEGECVLLSALNVLQGERYISLAERRPKDEEFVYGWLRARVML